MMRTHFAFPIVLIAVISLPGALAANTTYLQSDRDAQRTPAHAISLQYQTDAKASDGIVTSVYALSQDRYIAAVKGGQISPEDFGGWPVVARAQSEPVARDTAWQRHVTLPPLPIGQYAVVARVKDAVSVSTLNVTTVGLVGAAASSGITAYMPTDLRSFQTMPKATVSVLAGKQSREIVLKDGLAVVSDLPSDSGVVEARAPDGSIAVATLRCCGGGSQTDASLTGFVQTDRPVYRPGDSVGLRAIVRSGSMDAYRVPGGTLHLHVQSPDGSTVADRELGVSPFGTVNATIRLADDAPTGNYPVTLGDLQSNVLVAAYKKPEYAIAFSALPKHVVGGQTLALTVGARYFLGRPAAGMQVHYQVTSAPRYYWRWWGPYGQFARHAGFWVPRGAPIFRGEATTDGAGRATLSLPTKAVDADTDLGVQVDARDTSGRTVTLTGSVLLTQASVQVWGTPDNWVGTVGRPVRLRVYAQSYEGKPLSGQRVDVTMHVSHWNGRGNVDDATSMLQGTTGRDGTATVSFTPDRAGEYRFEITTRDEASRLASAQSYLWVTSTDQSWLAPIEEPMLVADNESVPANAPARFLLAIPKAGRDVLLVTTTDRMVNARIVHVAGTSARVDVPVPTGAAAFSVSALLPTENGVEQSTSQMTVSDPPHKLVVTVTPRKKRYEPGERATFDVRAVDAAGRPQRAEFGLGVVDQAIYAVEAQDNTDPVSVFYGASDYVNAEGTWFRPNLGLVQSAATADVYSLNSAYAAPVAMKTTVATTRSTGSLTPVRATFLDTAYWSPSVVTDANGKAVVSFAWPDDLTTWRAIGVGVTVAGDIGRGQGDALVTKDFLVRLEMPRFLRAGDRSTIVGIAQGQASSPNVDLTLAPGSLEALKDLDPALHLDANQSATAYWPVSVPSVGETSLTLSGSDGIRSDAMRLPLALLPATAAEHVRDAGDAARRPSLTVSIPRGYTAGAVHVSLQPSLIAELVQSQRLLDVYPYFCVEQTMSASLPSLYLSRVMRTTHLTMPSDVDIATILRHAVKRLGELQHADGSWGWWEHDDANPFMTAYALYGLSEFRKDGADVPQSMFDRGVDSLVEQLRKTNDDTLAFWGGAQPGSQWNTRAFMLFSLANAAPERVDRGLLDEAVAHAAQLNPYALSVLGLAEHALGNEADARRLLAALDRQAIDDGTFRRWQGETWHYRWEDDPIETTAYALRFEFAMGADADRVSRTVNFLRSQRRGNWWYTTKDTAAAIYALSQALPQNRSEFTPNETVRVSVDGRTLRTVHVTRPILDAADASIVIPAAQLHDGSVVTFERRGVGALYWSSDAVRYVPPDAGKALDPGTALFARLFAAPPALSVERTYTVDHPGPWRVGDEVTVDLTVTASHVSQFVAVEDPFPAGAEHVTEQGNAGDEAWSGLQILDDRAVFFADRLDPNDPLHIRYTLRVTTPGHYAAPGPSAYAMYGPPITALGRQAEVAVTP